MVTGVKAKINPEILKWARERMRFSYEEAAQAIGQKTTPKQIKAWENGTDLPLLSKLKHIAKQYWLPKYIFYFSKIPQLEEKPVADFRTIGDHNIHGFSPQLHYLINQLKATQETLSELISMDSQPINFVEKLKDSNKPKPADAADKIREIFDIKVDDPQLKSPTELQKIIKLFCSKIREKGVFLIFLSDFRKGVPIALSDFRGFTLSDAYAPLIAINTNDAVEAQLFTLIHEITHLFLGDSGISSVDCFGNKSLDSSKTERYCNNVAAEVLMPAKNVREYWQQFKANNLDETISQLKQVFHVSKIAATRRLFDLNLIEPQIYWKKYEQYRQYLKTSQEKKERERERKKKEGKSGGPNPYTLKENNYGRPMIKRIIRAVHSGDIPYREGARMLGCSTLTTFIKLENKLGL